MSASNTGTLTASLQSCSLNHNAATTSPTAAAGSLERSSLSDDLASADLPNPLPLNSENDSSSSTSDSTLQLVELNSHLSLPYNWEQCLDLKTGEIYYVNRRNGMQAKLDPRVLSSGESWGTGGGDSDRGSYSGEDDDSYEREGSSSGDSLSTSSSARGGKRRSTRAAARVQMASSNNIKVQREEVLVVAGCRNCLMYLMLPKRLVDCPKCSGQLLHFDRSEQYVSF